MGDTIELSPTDDATKHVTLGQLSEITGCDDLYRIRKTVQRLMGTLGNFTLGDLKRALGT